MIFGSEQIFWKGCPFANEYFKGPFVYLPLFLLKERMVLFFFFFTLLVLKLISIWSLRPISHFLLSPSFPEYPEQFRSFQEFLLLLFLSSSRSCPPPKKKRRRVTQHCRRTSCPWAESGPSFVCFSGPGTQGFGRKPTWRRGEGKRGGGGGKREGGGGGGAK